MLYLVDNRDRDINSSYRDYIFSQADDIIVSNLVSIAENNWKLKFRVSPNEYVSLSTYYWPNPDDINGRYIKKPEINYDKYKYSDRKYIDVIFNKIQYLALAYKLSKNTKYANQGVKFIKHFFLNSKTHMIPRLSHSGIILKNSIANTFTTHGCIIDTNLFSTLGDLVEIIFNGADGDNLRQKNMMMLWFKNMSDWFLYSDYGLKAKNRSNNWLTSYYVQVLSYLYACDQHELCKTMFENNFEQILITQIEDDGSQPYEQSRDHPVHYSNYNLHLLTRLALIGKKYDINIWSYKDSSGRGNIYNAMINTAQLIKTINKISEISPNYLLTWAKIAYNIYRDNIFKEIYITHENNLEYCLNEFIIS